ncbi:MAG: polyprenyl synthetase family protein [Bifidobacteriaceae bacterium]|jgi:geranylgeranyl diphosphate synthase type I|nr:polyprenyl synthetase family protein [Bifidobacteriaceae bacterium]
MNHLSGQPAAILDQAIATAGQGGKSVRARLVWRGWEVGGAGTAPAALPQAATVQLAAAIELFHDAALVHDDIIDQADTRRGHPSVHAAIRQAAHDSAWRGDLDALSQHLAILAGDLVQLASSQALAAGLAQADPGRRAYISNLFHTTCTEVMLGQALDTAGPALPWDEPIDPDRVIEAAWATIRAKTARYTVATPLAIGAAAAGLPPDICDALSDFGLPLGEAFQLRDDLEGALGDPDQAGKPVGQDLAEGKLTVLAGLTLSRLEGDARTAFWAHLTGTDGQLPAAARVAHLRQALDQAGAAAQVEALIRSKIGQALARLDLLPVADSARQTLRDTIVDVLPA